MVEEERLLSTLSNQLMKIRPVLDARFGMILTLARLSWHMLCLACLSLGQLLTKYLMSNEALTFHQLHIFLKAWQAWLHSFQYAEVLMRENLAKSQCQLSFNALLGYLCLMKEESLS